MTTTTLTKYTRQEATKYAAKLIELHLSGEGWYFKWDNALYRAGQCHFGSRTISISSVLFDNMSTEEFYNTITHEIAHAIVGFKAGHGVTWQKKHRELGGDGSRTSKVVSTAKPAWEGTCPSGHTVTRQRLTERTRRGSCPDCSPRYNEKYLFKWTKTVKVG